MASHSKDKELYFIGIIPPTEIAKQIEHLKQDICQSYGSRGALKAPPHITLHMPFKWKLSKESVLIEELSKFSKSIKPCVIELNNFNCFEPNVIYVSVVTNQGLTEMQKQLHRFCKTELNLFNAQYKALPFHPHITIAFRDLNKPMFYRAWEEYKLKIFSASFTFNKITLLKRVNNIWHNHAQFDIV